MQIKNKSVTYSVFAWVIAIVASFIYAPFGFIFSIIALIFGFKGLNNYKKDNSIGGKNQSMVLIVISGLLLILNLFTIILVLITTGTILI
jgi:hypothetical protein